MNQLPELFRTAPAVFAAGEDYQIMVPVNAQALFWVEVGEHKFYDHANGIMVSDTDMHRVCVPQNILDEAKSYTTVYRKIINRKPYFPETEEEVRTTFAFSPIRGFDETDTVRFYHIADTHGRPEKPIEAGKYFGENLDFLILNGDIIDHSGDTGNFEVIFRIAEALTGGKKPVICSRGNHDMRGFCAERIKDYTPAVNGKTYYTTRLGDLYFIILDCAEDKDDSSPEYGHTVACHAFREEQTAYLYDIAAHPETTTKAPGVVHTFVISHMPFTHIDNPPFDIEQDTYREWTRILTEEIQPELLIAGHMHRAEIWMPGGKNDAYGQDFPAVICAEPCRDGSYIGGAFTVTREDVSYLLTDDSRNVAELHKN
ncbi:MAG: metallophosphoesterase [Clostridia bacterium]|nr:metallophosphoesterase [Clostridia bacterium]